MKRVNRSLLFMMLALVMALGAIPAFGFDLVEQDQSPTINPSADEANEAPLLHANNPSVIEGQYIVVMKKATTNRAAESLANRMELRGAEINFMYTGALNGFAAQLSKDNLKTVLNNDMVAYVEADQMVKANVTWGLDRTDQRNLPLNNVFNSNGDYNGSGAGTHSYIVDTGIKLAHNEFSGRMGNGYDAVTSGGNANDCNGHGTHVAGTVGGSTYGMAPSTTLHPVRVLDCGGSGSNAGVIAGVDWVRNNHIDPAVANMSLGGGASTALDNAVNNAINAGVTFVVAAGNDNANACNYSPARVNNAITVGSTTSSDSRSSFSNTGSCVDVFAPGSSITSAWHTSNSATNTISGTSMASPHVAGAAALYLGNNGSASPATVFSAILNNATSGVISSVGSGSPNLLLYVGDGGGTTPPPSGCSGYSESYSGSLSGTGDWDAQPNGTYYYSGSGTHEGCLEGPSSADFDLQLRKWQGGGWAIVAQSTSASSSEDITYSGSTGYYYWRVLSYSGSGSYDFGMTRP